VHPELGTLDDFASFVRTARAMGMEIALDYALQCAADHPWVAEHPEWFNARADGTIRHAENPPKKYEDIYPLNFWCPDRERLWTACKDVLLFWIQQGVRIFRVDNPHTKPFPFWEWLIREVQAKYPDVILLAEAFTRPKRMYGLAKVGFTQSYTYFTWKNAKWELGPYLEELNHTEVVEYFRPNFFTNTPDILHEYLQRGGRTAFRVRLLLAATSSPLYGIYSGFELCENTPVRRGSEEYLNSEKYEIRVRDWNAPGHLKADIALLNKLRREHAALQEIGNLSLLRTESEDILAYRRSAPNSELFVVVNLDPHRPRDTMLELPLAELGLRAEQPFEVEDLLTGARYLWRGAKSYVRLDPAERVGHLFRLVRVG
jgi:starch synthase (maltosyl-transferring)